MEKRNLKVLFTKGGSGSISPRITIPKKWTDKLELNQEERDVEMFLDEENESIVIKKLKK